MKAERLRAWEIAPDAIKALKAVEGCVAQSALETSLAELVKVRASQINGCSYCLEMHSTQARKSGESEQRLHVLSAWHQSGLYSERERAALAWTDAITKIAQSGAPDELYEALQTQFSEKEIVDLTLLVGLINVWNRIAISFRYVSEQDVTKQTWSAPVIREFNEAGSR